MKIDVIEEVAEGRAHVSWSSVKSTYKEESLIIYVFRDAMKFDDVPALTWDWKPVSKKSPWYTNEVFDGVRLPASAEELQVIADLTGCMMLTPKVIDLIWLQAQLKFDPVLNTARYPGAPSTQRTIVAESHLHVVHQEIEKKITDLGGDQGQLIASVGKYWCLINRLSNLMGLRFGVRQACNYGWPSSDGRYSGVTPGIKCWQEPGYRHDHFHWDPSQTIRLMYRRAKLIHADGRREWVDLHDIASSRYAGLIHHETNELTYLRQRCVPKPEESMALSIYAPDIDLAA